MWTVDGRIGAHPIDTSQKLGQGEVRVGAIVASAPWRSLAGTDTRDDARQASSPSTARSRRGITLIDTAEVYGNGKSEVSSAAPNVRDRRDRAVVATKASKGSLPAFARPSDSAA
ncbi:MAG: aldo/keto reductase [Myxococcales bacterium]|nr:aldo/keto reductase [Myxococcales bacterium]